MMDPIDILLVDDHLVIRQGMRSFLEDDQKYRVVAEATDGTEALTMLPRHHVDLVITDINMKTMDGITCTREIVKQYPDTKVLALTMINENQHIKEMMKAGASGYVLKSCGEEDIKNAIDAIMTGSTYYSDEVTLTIMNSFSRARSNSSKYIQEIPLTPREEEVLRLILDEYSNQEIADALFISIRTVEAHKRNLIEKTGSKNIAGLVVHALNNQLV